VSTSPTPPVTPTQPSPELIERLAKAAWTCDSEPLINAHTVPDRWAVYQRQAMNILWPILRDELEAAGRARAGEPDGGA
jgi:hypothetical protein